MMKSSLFGLYLLAFAVLGVAAQGSATNYSGVWKLDTGLSKLAPMAAIESMTMTVSQDADSFTVSTETKRSAQRGDPGGGGMGRGGFGGVGDGTFTYKLDGKETRTEQATQFGTIPVRLKAMPDKDKLKLSMVRSLTTPMGEVTMTTREEWVLSQDGKTLTVTRNMETPRGTNLMTMVFKKSE
jgi:hypothetical protein